MGKVRAVSVPNGMKAVPETGKMNQKDDIQQRVRDLLSQMSLEEKLAQLTMQKGADLFENGVFNAARAKELFGTAGVGALLFPRVPNTSVAQAVDRLRQVWRFLKETMRIPVPPFIIEEALHGVMFHKATVFPQSIAMASTWNEDLVGQLAGAISSEASALGITQVLCPDLDLCREPRWGRIEETFGEDVCLTSRLGKAYVENLQKLEHGKCRGVAATLKHFAVHGTPEGGINLAPVQAGERLVREYYLAPFRKVIRETDPLCVMPAYSELDGVPCSASRHLLTCVLREQLGFDGYVISDFGALEMLVNFHHTASSSSEAGKQALHAGVDMEAPVPYCFDKEFLCSIRRGEVPIEEIDRAAARVLTAKLRAGLFEKSDVSAEQAETVVGCAAHRRLAYDAALESIVLLENRHEILPLQKSIRSIAVIGPNADTWQLGDYSADRPCKTPLQAIRERAGKGTEVLYAQGCGLYDLDTSGIEQAVQLARSCEVTVLCVGGSSTVNYGIGWGQDVRKAKNCGEGFDVSDLGLPGKQQQLAKALLETGAPVIVVHIDGRPASIPYIARRCAALLEMWYAGQEGADALAAILFGDANPSGKLPVSVPASVGQAPAYYNYKPSGRGFYHQPGTETSPGRDYVFSSPDPLYSFGYGLSYTKFCYSQLCATYDPEKEEVLVSVQIENCGNFAGKEVVQVFVHDEVASVTRPVRELKAFKKIFLKAGESMRVPFSIPKQDLAFLDQEYRWVVEPGRFSVFVGDQTADFLIEQ